MRLRRRRQKHRFNIKDKWIYFLDEIKQLKTPLDWGRFFLYYLERFLRPVMALAALILGFCLVILLSQLYHSPEKYIPSENQIAKWGLDAYVAQFRKFSGIVTQNAELTMVRDNMERMRLMLDAFHVEGGAGGAYPLSVDILYQHANSKGFWNLTRNPITKALSYPNIVGNYSDYELSYDKSRFSGMILYELLEKPVGTYRIYACDKKGKLLEVRGRPFYISNRENQE